MNENTRIPVRSRLHRMVATAAIVAALSAGSVLAAAPANASSYGPGAGTPGAVHPGYVIANGSEKPYTIYGVGVDASLRIPAVTIYRSPGAAGAQTATVLYRLIRWDGARWVVAMNSQQYTTSIGASQSGVTIDPGMRLVATNAGHYYMDVNVYWYSAGRHIASQNVLMNHSNDYRCIPLTSGRQTGICGVQNGMVVVS